MANNELLDYNPLSPPLPKESSNEILAWGQLTNSELSFALANASNNCERPFIVLTNSLQSAYQLERELKIFSKNTVYTFPDWETLPYDGFSPHQDIISERILALSEVPKLKNGILIVPITTALQKITPTEYIKKYAFNIRVGETIDLIQFKQDLIDSGYKSVNTVTQHGEFAFRGSIVDLFPMGIENPIRIDFFDDEIDSIRLFDTDTQLSDEQLKNINCLPAKEYPMTEEGISVFRNAYREMFPDKTKSHIYKGISKGLNVGGIEYYLPLFFNQLASIFDYLPKNSILVRFKNQSETVRSFLEEVNLRYEQYRYNQDRPLLEPNNLYLKEDELFTKANDFTNITVSNQQNINTEENKNKIENKKNKEKISKLFSFQNVPDIGLSNKTDTPYIKLESFINEIYTSNDTYNKNQAKILFCAESSGRAGIILDLLQKINIKPKTFENWQKFYNSNENIGITVAPLEHSICTEEGLYMLAEAHIYGNKIPQRKKRKKSSQTSDNAIKHLTELKLNDLVVHLKHGIGKYKGLITLNLGDTKGEFLILEYAKEDKIYVPITSLNLISRYSAKEQELVSLHKLGNEKWSKDKQKALKKAQDVAAKLLNVYAKRELKPGYNFSLHDEEVYKFANSFPFEETNDQLQSIKSVQEDMNSNKCMDRLICGDVGFGKTEVAMRAAFIAVQNNKQVAVLVPTTLLAQQHYNSFIDRFAGWPINIAMLSRFTSNKDNIKTLENLEKGTIDIIIGTHKLIQDKVKIKNLGLLIIDEEHRFGVSQKEKFRAMRSEVDILTLTATPIPRTLNMAVSGIRDLSIIASPPAKRIAIKTFVHEYDKLIIKEAITRELLRGGQVYFLHNSVETIENKLNEIKEIVPNTKIRIAHGQMRERELENVMADFYHQRFDILLCTTIIETGIDVPSANTIIMDRADKLGLAQLHQLRGRVGRSHHQAYAYLLTKEEKNISSDAKKRLRAIQSLEELGAGFTLASQDLEIRGAGELLGEEQSGHIQAVGFDLYTKILNKTIKELKKGNLDITLENIEDEIEINLHIPCYIPDDYLPNIPLRLVMYKKISNAKNNNDLEKIQSEMLNRFGLFTDEIRNLFAITELKLKLEQMGIKKVEANDNGGYLEFNRKPNINTEKLIKLIQVEYRTYKLQGMAKLNFKANLKDKNSRISSIHNIIKLIEN